MANPNLPVYELELDELTADSGIKYMALVDDPAIEQNFIALSRQFKFASVEEERVVFGPGIVPDQLIYRNDPEHGEHYVRFSGETIKKTVQKFFRQGKIKDVNLMHEEGAVVENVYMFQSFISDSKLGIAAPATFKDLPEGTWFVAYKVDNDEVWNEFIKTGTFKGFSIEGFFNYAQPDKEEQIIKQIAQLLQQPDSDVTLTKIKELVGV